MTESKDLGPLLLDVGVSLLKAGASCSRTRITMLKFADGYDYEPQIMIGPKSVSLSLNDKDGFTVFNGIRAIAAQGINFTIVSAISRLSRTAAEKKFTIHELRKELTKCTVAHHYPRIIVLCFVSLAGAAFCYTFGGSFIEMIITFGATFFGLFTKQKLGRYNFNPYFCTSAAAVVASFFTAILHVAGIGDSPVHAFSACVLFLVPGVLLINSFTDLIDGNTMNGTVRGINALMHAMAIALGLATTIIIFNLGK